MMTLFMRLLLSILCLTAAITSSLHAEEANFVWAKSLGYTASSPVIAADSAGNVFDACSEGMGETATGNMVVKKVDSSGNVLWTSKLKTKARPEAAAASPQGDWYIVGSAASGAFAGAPIKPEGAGSIYIIKYSASGDLLWIHLEGESNNAFSPLLTVDESGNRYLAGLYSQTARFGGVALPTTAGADDYRMFLVKYAGDGSVSWEQTAAGAYPSRMSIDKTGNILFTVSSLVVDSTSVTLGDKSAEGGPSFIAKYDPNGKVGWINSIPSGAFHPNALHMDQDGNAFALALILNGGFSVTKWNPGGTLLWEQQFVLPYLAGDDLVVDGNGNCLVALRYSRWGETATFGQAAFTTTAESELGILSFTPSGDLRWAISSTSIYSPTYQSPGVNNPTTSDLREARLAMSPNGTCWVTARMKGTIQFGSSKVVGPSYNGGDVALLATIVDPELVVAAPPSLQILPSGNGLTLSWPDAAAGFILESAGSLGGAAVWTPVNNPAASGGGFNSVQLDRPEQSAFYRLKKP